MKTCFLLFTFCLFSFTTFDQLPKPKICTACEYGYSRLDTKFLAGANRGYYGSEERKKEGLVYSAVPQDNFTFLLGDLYPAMGERALFWNYSESGVAHLTELDRSVKCFKYKGRNYPVACGNLLEFCSNLKTIKAPQEKPAPVIMERETIYVSAPVELPPAIIEEDIVVQRRPQVLGEVYLVVTEIAFFERKGCCMEPAGASYSNGVLQWIPATDLPLYPRVIDKFTNPYGVSTVTSLQLRNLTPGDAREREARKLREYYGGYGG